MEYIPYPGLCDGFENYKEKWVAALHPQVVQSPDG